MLKVEGTEIELSRSLFTDRLLMHGCLGAAREIAAAEGDVGPLQPHHVHAAYQRLDKQGVIPGQKRKRRALSH